MFVKISENKKAVSFSVESLEYIWTLLKMAPAYWVSWNWQVIFLKNRYGFVQVEIEVAALLGWLLSALAKYVIHQTGWTSLDLEISSPKENGKLQICNDFWYPLRQTYEVLDTMARHGVYSFLDGFCGYHQILNRWTLSSALAVNISFMMWMMLYLPPTPCPALHSPESPQLEMPATGACLCSEDCNQAWNPWTLSKYMVYCCILLILAHYRSCSYSIDNTFHHPSREIH
jgi:hypothetical protein